MKKIMLFALFAFVFALGISACGKKAEQQPAPAEAEEVVFFDEEGNVIEATLVIEAEENPEAGETTEAAAE